MDWKDRYHQKWNYHKFHEKALSQPNCPVVMDWKMGSADVLIMKKSVI